MSVCRASVVRIGGGVLLVLLGVAYEWIALNADCSYPGNTIIMTVSRVHRGRFCIGFSPFFVVIALVVT